MGAGQPALTGWRVALRLGRVSNLPTVWSNGMAGVVLAGGGLADARLALLLAAFTLFYVAGMFLNDAFDHEIDSRERPERPIPAGQIDTATVFLAGFAMLGLALALLAPLGWRPMASGAALAAAILYYDLHHKRNPLSPLIMGICRILLYATAALAVAPVLPLAVTAGALALLSYLVGLTYVAKQEGLGELGSVWPLLFLAVPFLYIAPDILSNGAMALLYLGFLAWVLYALSLVVRRRIPQAVTAFIAGIALLDGLLMAGQGHLAGAGAAVGAFLLTRLFQRYVPGT